VEVEAAPADARGAHDVIDATGRHSVAAKDRQRRFVQAPVGLFSLLIAQRGHRHIPSV